MYKIKHMKVITFVMFLLLGAVPLTVVGFLIYFLIGNVYKNDTANVMTAIAVTETVLAFLTIGVIFYGTLIIHYVSKPFVAFTKKLKGMYTSEQLETLSKGFSKDFFSLTLNSIDYFLTEKSLHEESVERIEELTEIIACTNAIVWSKKKNNTIFTLGIPSIWQQKYEGFLLKQEVNLDQYLHPNSVIGFLGVINSFTNKPNRAFEIDLWIKATETEYIAVRMHGFSRMDGGMEGTLTDVNSEYMLRKRSNQNVASYNFLLETIDDIICELDMANDTIKFMNKEKAVALFGGFVHDAPLKEFNQIYQKRIHSDYKSDYAERFSGLDHILFHPKETISFDYMVMNAAEDYIFVNQKMLVIEQEDGHVTKAICRITDINGEKRKEYRAIYHSNHDSLTGAFLFSAFKKEYETTYQYGEGAGVIVFNIDRFSHINAQYGYEIGDMGLRYIVNLLWKFQRENCIVGRIVSDKFVMAVSSTPLKIESAIRSIISLVVAALEVPTHLKTHMVYFSISTGSAFFKTTVHSFEDMYEAAKDAISKAKEEGLNKHVITSLEDPHVTVDCKIENDESVDYNKVVKRITTRVNNDG